MPVVFSAWVGSTVSKTNPERFRFGLLPAVFGYGTELDTVVSNEYR